mmetsp:Transcript_15681/g.37400  ORF Transcript_15681/g.37400 Transcript_15681/m.37400 type:complete len:212 (+) Transcript_15681:564-1199(+)
MNDADFVVDKGVGGAYGLCVGEEKVGELKVVRSQVLDTDAQRREMAAAEMPRRRAIGGESLVALILCGECVPQPEPCRSKVSVRRGRLVEVTASLVVLARDEVVARHRVPRHSLVRVIVDELVGEVEQFTGTIEGGESGDVEGGGRQVVGVLLEHPSGFTVAGVEVGSVEELVGGNGGSVDVSRNRLTRIVVYAELAAIELFQPGVFWGKA